MKRKQKELVVSSLIDKLTSANSVIVVHQKGLTVEKSNKFRRSLTKSKEASEHVFFMVAKNTLVKKALKNTEYEKLTDLFSGPTAIIYSKDSVAAARGLVNFKKENNEELEILGGVVDNNFVNEATINEIATLPSLNELRARIIGVINAPATKIAGVIKAPVEKLVRVINVYSTTEE